VSGLMCSYNAVRRRLNASIDNLLRLLSQLLSDFAPFELLHHSENLRLLSLTGTSLVFYALLARAAAQRWIIARTV
jgi:hypothetical protein